MSFRWERCHEGNGVIQRRMQITPPTHTLKNVGFFEAGPGRPAYMGQQLLKVGDIEINPGPPHICPNCHKKVTSRSVWCHLGGWVDTRSTDLKTEKRNGQRHSRVEMRRTKRKSNKIQNVTIMLLHANGLKARTNELKTRLAKTTCSPAARHPTEDDKPSTKVQRIQCRSQTRPRVWIRRKNDHLSPQGCPLFGIQQPIRAPTGI